MTYFTSGAWQIPVVLDGTINQYGASGPAISMDGQTLFFSSDRPGGFGGSDIWKSTRNSGIWQAPVNLGPLVNTAGNELNPSIAGNDTDFVFERTNGTAQDTMSIWFIELGSGSPSECLFHGHYEPHPSYGSYWFTSPCISWNGQNIFVTYNPDNMEPLSYIYCSSRPVAVESDPRSAGGSGPRRAFLAAPNPARSCAVISFDLPRAGRYGLKVFNLVGQQVKAFAGTGKAGANAVAWNVAGVPNGVYFCQLGFEGGTATQRMVVLR